MLAVALFHSDYGWYGPPTCLLSIRAPVETGTPPLSIGYASLAGVSNRLGKGATRLRLERQEQLAESRV